MKSDVDATQEVAKSFRYRLLVSVLARLLVGAIAGWAIMYLWNDTVQFLFSRPQIGYRQAVELYFLVSLFGVATRK